jgi:hypothetical protein
MALDPRRIEILLAKQEIHELHCIYCRGIDRLDEALIRSVFHPDAVIHHQPWYDGGVDKYLELVLASAKGQLEGSWCHMVTNELTRVDGERAASEWYLFQLNRVQDAGKPVDHILAARFLERLEQRNGVWKVSERALVRDVIRLDPVGEQWSAAWPALARGATGKRGQEDLSYQYLGDALGSER